MIEQRTQKVLSAVVLAALTGGCGASDTISDALERDSAGIRIVELPASASAAREIRVVADTSFAVPASIEFGEILDIGAAGGVVAVLDGLEATVTVFDTTGSVIAQFGRQGGGPGEFNRRGLASVIVVDGAIWVPDVASQRLTRFAADGAMLETVPLPFSQGHAVDWAAHPSGGHMHRLRKPSGDLLIRASAAGMDTLHRFPASLDPPNTVLAATPLWTMLPDGAMVFGFTDRFELSLFRADQRRPDWIVRRDRTAREVTDSERAHLLGLLEASLLRRTGGEISPGLRERMLSGVRLPNRAPVLAGIWTGPERTIWVRRARTIESMGLEVLRVGVAAGLGSNEWEIFDRDGSFVGTATLPDRFEPKVFVGRLIYGVQTDDMGVQTVKRLRV